jgi:uncharacterized circularly permuted ATP-grasp superfamily protein/uncharacterized alpha-E superfamily protein
MPAYDEVRAPDGRTRSHWRTLERSLLSADPVALVRAQDRVRRLRRYQGTTPVAPAFRPDSMGALDPIPHVLPTAEWAHLEAGLRQRAHLLDRLLADCYGPRAAVEQGLLPAGLLYSHEGFLRCCAGITPPRWLVASAVDLVRGPDGGFLVRTDRIGTPQGLGEMLSARRVLAQLHPELYRRLKVQRLDAFYDTLRSTLASLSGDDDPRTLILTPGPQAGAFPEHAYLARTLGYTLVVGSDLTVRDGRVWLMSVAGLERADVVLRLVADRMCDPLELQPGSAQGPPGLVEACRRGTVSVANPPGTGLLEHPGFAPFLPGLCQALLGEELALPPVPTWWCGDKASRSHVLAHLDDMVLRPVAPGVTDGRVTGRELDAAGRKKLRARVEASPHLWVGMEEVEASATPFVHEGHLEEGRLGLRCFVVADGGDYQVLPGGLARATRDGTGEDVAVRKDAWVLAEAPHRLVAPALTLGQVDFGASLPSRNAEALYWIGRHAEAAETAIRLVQTIGWELGETPELATEAGGAWLTTFTACLGWISENPRTFSEAGASQAAAAEGEDPVGALLQRALVDEEFPRSLVSTLGELLQASLSAREMLSTDTCQVLVALEDRLSALRGAATQTEVEELAASTFTNLMALVGLSAESMVRDPGWFFTDIGRRLERARILVRMLGETLLAEPDPDVAGLVYETLLACCESLVAFRRRYRSDVEVHALAHLLLLDSTNPRSLGFQLDQLRGDLQRLPGGRQASALAPVEAVVEQLFSTSLVDLLALTRRRRPRLGEWLELVGERLDQVAEAVRLTYFAHVPGRSL